MELLFALVYYLKDIISSNLDLFYFLAVPFLLYDFARDMGKVFRRAFVAWLPILFYGIYQIAFFAPIDSTRVLVNIAKIFVCIFLMFFVKENAERFNFNAFIRSISYLFLLSIPVGLFFRSPPLWRTNDTINKYVLNRLQLFYIEPSALSFQVCILLVFIAYFIINKINVRENVLFFMSLLVIVYLSAGMNGMICLALSGIAMLLAYYYRRSKTVIISLAGILLVGGAVLYILAAADNPIYLRAEAALAGNDSSALYRLNVGYEVMKNALINTNGAGVGFGNINTEFFRSTYSEYGLVSVVANSFMYFIIEGGIFSIIYLLILLISVFRHSIRDKEALLYKLPLFLFVFIYQIPGSYFTNPVIWLAYGFICSNARIEERNTLASPCHCERNVSGAKQSQ